MGSEALVQASAFVLHDWYAGTSELVGANANLKVAELWTRINESKTPVQH